MDEHKDQNNRQCRQRGTEQCWAVPLVPAMFLSLVRRWTGRRQDPRLGHPYVRMYFLPLR